MLNFSSDGLQLGGGGEVWIKKCTSPIERNLTNLLKLIFHISLVLACNMVILVDTFKKRYTVDYGTNVRYCISSNNNRPSINRLPRIIPPPLMEILKNHLPRIIVSLHPSRHFLFLLSPHCQVEVDSDPATLISDDSSSEN